MAGDGWWTVVERIGENGRVLEHGRDEVVGRMGLLIEVAKVVGVAREDMLGRLSVSCRSLGQRWFSGWMGVSILCCY